MKSSASESERRRGLLKRKITAESRLIQAKITAEPLQIKWIQTVILIELN